MSARQQQVYQGLIAAGFIDEHMHHSKNSNSSNNEENLTSESSQPIKKEKKSIFPWSKRKKDKDKKKEKESPSVPADVANLGHSQIGVTSLNHNQVQLRKTPARNQDSGSFRGVELSLVKTWGPESLHGIDLNLDPSELEGIVNTAPPRNVITRQAVRPFADDTASMYEEPTDFFVDSSPPQHPRPLQWAPPQSWHVQQAASQSIPEDSVAPSSKSVASLHSHSRSSSQTSSMYLFRIFRPNDTFGTVSCSLNCTTKTLVGMVTKKFHVIDPTKYNLIFRRNESEMVLKSNEKPVEMFIQLLTQMGYTDPKELIDLNREDLSHIGKFILREASLSYTLSVQSPQPSNGDGIANMWGRNLETVPISLYKIADTLKTLDLSRNPRLDFPLDFAQLCLCITKLNLARNNYSHIPDSISVLQTLRILDLSSNLIETLEGANLEKLQILDQLYIWNNQLSTIPQSFSSLNRLTVLLLSNNCLTHIPSPLFQLTQLRTLDLSFNLITAIPNEISQLVNLTHFSISSNNLKGRLSSALSKLERLIEVDVRRNDLNNVDSLTKLQFLEHLYCDYNSISQVDFRLPKLCYLSLNNNDQLNSFTSQCVMNYLTILDLSQCGLNQLGSEFFASMPYIVQIKLDDNELKELPTPSSDHLKHLEMFSCNRNVLTQVPEIIFELPKLNALDLHCNQIKSVPQGIWFSKLNYLNMSSNVLEQFPVPPNLNPTPTMLPLPIRSSPGNNTKNSTPKALSLPAYIEYLILADNRLTEDAFQPISLFKKLITLNLSLNQIYEVPPQAFYHFVDLQELSLSSNHLSNFMVEDLDRLKSLKTLNLNGNKLTTLPSELSKLSKLNYFDVSCNNLKYNIYNWEYDWNWNWNPNLKYLNLSGNKRLQIQYNITGGGANYIAEFSRLNNLKILGLMDVTVSAMVNLPDETPSRRVRTAASIMNEMTYGVSDRLSSTDDILAWDLAFPKFRDQDDECLYGLMNTVPSRQTPDIEEVGKKLYDSFQSTFLSELSKKSKGNLQPDEITSAIRSTFLTLQRDVMAHCSASTLSSTSMTMMYIKGSNLYLANVGDVQALLGQRGGRFKVITQLHVPGLPNMSDEITRVRQTGGYVSNDGFVNGEFSLSRCFGAFSHLPTINANPYISCIPLSGHDEFIIMAGRGIWEVISHEMAINIVRMAKRDYMIAAQKIKDLAVAYGAKRHIMVMIIGLNQLAYLRRKPTRKIKGHKLGPGFSIDLPSFDPSDAVGLSIHKSKKSRKPIREEDVDILDTLSMKREIEAPTGQLALVMTDIKNSTNLWEIATRGMEEGIKRHNKVMRHYLDLYGGYEVKTEGDAFIVSFPTVTSALLWCMTTQLELLKIEWPSEILATDDGREILDPDSENRQVLYKGLSVRMGMNFGSPLCDQNIITGRMDYYGPMVNRASRISSAADGGELCISSDVVSELMTIPGLFDFEEDGPKSSSPEIAEKQLGQLDEKMQQEIIGLKKLGLRLICLGEKKLKGLETPETLYMVYPKVLVGRSNPGIRKNATRYRTYSTIFSSAAPRMEDQLPVILKYLGPLCIRLENLTRYHLRPSNITVSLPNSPTTATPTAGSSNEFTEYFIKQFHQTLDELSQEYQVDLLSSLIGRIENSISTLTLCNIEGNHWEQMLDQIAVLLQSGIQLLEEKKQLTLISDKV